MRATAKMGAAATRSVRACIAGSRGRGLKGPRRRAGFFPLARMMRFVFDLKNAALSNPVDVVACNSAAITTTTNGETSGPVTTNGADFVVGQFAQFDYGYSAGTNVAWTPVFNTASFWTGLTEYFTQSAAGSIAAEATSGNAGAHSYTGMLVAIMGSSGGSAPTVSSVSPNSGTTAGGTAVTITGTNFASGATVTFGGAAATNVVVASSTSITATTPAGSAGAVTVAVTVGVQSGSLASGFTYSTSSSGPVTLSQWAGCAYPQSTTGTSYGGIVEGSSGGGCDATSSISSAVVIDMPAATTAGDALLVVIQQENQATSSVASVTGGSTGNPAFRVVAFGSNNACVDTSSNPLSVQTAWVLANAPAQSKITLNLSGTPSADRFAAFVFDLKNASLSNPVDVVACNSAAITRTTNGETSGSVTTNGADFVVGQFAQFDYGYSAGTNVAWTPVFNNTYGWTGLTEYFTQSAAGSIAAEATSGNAGAHNYTGMLVAIMGSSGL